MAFYQRQPDIIIRNGTIVDGTGKLPYYADIAIVGDKIDYIGNLKGVSAPLEIDAHHKYVTPGFIDSHNESDYTIFSYPDCENAVRQGITTGVVGQCGAMKYDVIEKNADGTYDKTVAAKMLDKAENMQFAMNTAWLCGHNGLRDLAGVHTTYATEEQYQVMEDILREAMEAGFCGFSTGLEFAPGTLCKPEEVERLAQIVVDYDGNYSSHMRDEGYYFLEAVNEFLNVIRKTGLRGTVSHMNIKYDNGVPNDWLFKGIQMLKDARDIEHLNVYTDMLSTLSGPGGTTALLPPWLYAEGWDKAREILADPVGREKVKNDMDRYWRFVAAGQLDRILYMLPEYDEHIAHTPFPKLVEESGKEPIDVFLDVIMNAPTMASVGLVIGEMFKEQFQIDSVVKDPIYMWMTDTNVYPEDGPMASSNSLNYMAMIYFFTRYVRDLGVISIQDAVYKVGALPAHHFHLEGRGVLEVGNYADINVFDLYALKINASHDDPSHFSEGMDYVIINGKPIIAKGEFTGDRNGRVLRHLPKK